MDIGRPAFGTRLCRLAFCVLAIIPLQRVLADAPAPTVEFPTAVGISYTSATLGGNVTDQGDSAITGRGVVYSVTLTNPDPQIGGLGVTLRIAPLGTGTGVFTIASSLLTPGTQYSIRAYATNGAGTAYSATATFTTPADPPVVISPTVASIGTSSATLGGNVTADNSSTILERGVLFSSTDNDPGIGEPGVTTQTVPGSTGVFTASITGLQPTTFYYYKAYATNGAGTTYSPLSTFTTLPYAPSVTSPTATSVTINSAILGGNVTSANSAAITQRGVVYSDSTSNGDPSLTNGASIAIAGTTSTGVFTIPVTGLQSSKLYYFRAYATNSVGTTYSWTSTFGTLPYSPSVTSPTYSSLAITTVTLGGNVSSDNSAAITERGVVYSVTSVNSSPRLTNGASVAVDPTASTGVFTISVSGLLPSTNYSFRAYATNSIGTTYSWTNTFTTLPYAPSIGSPVSSLVTGKTAVLGGHVTSDNSGAITQRGVVYSSTDNSPRIGDLGVIDEAVPGTTGVFTKAVTGLLPRTQYFFRAYAINSAGTGYTSIGTFTTPDVPTVIEPTCGSVTTTGAVLGGNVSSDNLAAITERGVVYSISAENNNPLLGAADVTKEVVAGTTGAFTEEIAGLANGTTYTYRAYAVNSEGTSYTDVDTFTTVVVAPRIASTTTKSLPVTDADTAASSVTLGGSITLYGQEVIERGVVYSLTGIDSNPQIGDEHVTVAVSDDTAGGNGPFTIDITGLSAYKTYSFRAFVTNSAGTSYTSIDKFNTPAVAPLISSATDTEETSTGVTLGASVTHDGGRPITLRGVVYSSTNEDPSIGGAGVTVAYAAGTTGVFAKEITGLKPGITYFYRAFAVNAVGTKYTTTTTFTTLVVSPAVASIPTHANITSTLALLGGEVVGDGGADIEQYIV